MTYGEPSQSALCRSLSVVVCEASCMLQAHWKRQCSQVIFQVFRSCEGRAQETNDVSS